MPSAGHAAHSRELSPKLLTQQNPWRGKKSSHASLHKTVLVSAGIL